MLKERTVMTKAEIVLAEVNKMIAEHELAEIDGRIFGNINIGRITFVTWGEARISFKWLFSNVTVRFEQQNNHLVIKELSVAGCSPREEQYHLESLIAYIRMILKADDRYQTLAHLKANEINNHLNDINVVLERPHTFDIEELFREIKTESISDSEVVVLSGDHLVQYIVTGINLIVIRLHMNFQADVKEGFMEYADAVTETLLQIKQNIKGNTKND